MQIPYLIKRRYRHGGIRAVAAAIPRFILKPILLRYRKLKDRLSSTDYQNQDGIKVDTSNPFVRQIDSLYLGNYEEQEITLIKRYLPRDISIIELGSGIGYTSCYINQKLDSNTKHVTIEANPDLIPLIERHRSLNNATFGIQNAAYVPNEDTTTFASGDHFLTGNTHSRGVEVTEVAGISLDEICQTEGIESFFLVADIEGAEIELIEQEAELLRERCRGIIVEFHPDIDSPTAARKKLNGLGFRQIASIDDVEVYRRED